MAIEPIKKVTIVSRKRSGQRLMETINRLGFMQVTELKEIQESDEPSLKICDVSTEELDERLHQIDLILNLTHVFSPEMQSFIQGVAPTPIVTSQQEINSILNAFNLQRLFERASELDETYRSAERVISEIESELKELEPLSDLPFSPADFHFPARTHLLFGYLPRKNLILVEDDTEPWSRVAWEEVASAPLRDTAAPSERGEERIRMVFASLAQDSDDLRKALASLEFDEIQLPKLSVRISERIDELSSDLAEYRHRVDKVSEEVKSLAQGQRRSLLILRAHWQNIKNTHLASTKAIQGEWVYVLGGYIRQRDAQLFLDTVGQEFPDSEVTIQDPAPEDDVPVGISVPYLFRPLQVLVEMFGLPPYRSFDPTPFMQVNFYLFFGICFSDVFYGLMLTASGAFLAAKTRVFQGLNNFSRILFHGGMSSILFGALTGSWFGDLYKPEYLGEGNFLQRLAESLTVIDPMSKTILALICALGIGVLNQFYGISLKMYGAIRHRDWMGAFSDGLCWLITLPGFLIVASSLIADVPPRLFSIGLWLFSIGAVLLILTQGRDIKNPFGRIAAGLVSLYGIMGSYGISAFIGDTLSYCRLLALGLTTSIVAMSFNLMGGMVKETPYIGMILFVLLLVVGHVFNFAISVLGAFVHSMRLIFVEFFGRFYEAGSRPFQPLGFDSSTCIMIKSGDPEMAGGR